MGEFKDKVVLITGASSGIGASTAELFAKHEASLVLVGRNKDNLEKTANICESTTKNILKIVADLNQDEEINKVIEQTLARFNRLDVLINNAGVLESGSIESTSIEQYERVFSTNVRAIYLLSHLAVKSLATTQGCIVNVSSVCGIRAFPNVLAYCMSKAALDQFTRCTALELAPKKIRVNAVNPGVITTGIHMRSGENKMSLDAYNSFLQHSKETHALGRPGEPNEVAEAIFFLANNRTSSFITGETLAIDGGRHAMCPR